MSRSRRHEMTWMLTRTRFANLLSRAEQKQAALEAQQAALAASGHETGTTQKKRKREREESVATGDGESVRPAGNRKKNRVVDDD